MIQTEKVYRVICDKCLDLIETHYENTHDAAQTGVKPWRYDLIALVDDFDDLGEKNIKEVNICEGCLLDFQKKYKFNFSCNIYSFEFISWFKNELATDKILNNNFRDFLFGVVEEKQNKD